MLPQPVDGIRSSCLLYTSDDRTPGAIKATGTRIVSYGAPVLPGDMMLVSYYEKDGRQIPILGLPGCVMYAKNTIFDLLLPRLMADDEITLSEINQLGEGGPYGVPV